MIIVTLTAHFTTGLNITIKLDLIIAIHSAITLVYWIRVVGRPLPRRSSSKLNHMTWRQQLGGRCMKNRLTS